MIYSDEELSKTISKAVPREKVVHKYLSSLFPKEAGTLKNIPACKHIDAEGSASKPKSVLAGASQVRFEKLESDISSLPDLVSCESDDEDESPPLKTNQPPYKYVSSLFTVTGGESKTILASSKLIEFGKSDFNSLPDLPPYRSDDEYEMPPTSFSETQVTNSTHLSAPEIAKGIAPGHQFCSSAVGSDSDEEDLAEVFAIELEGQANAGSSSFNLQQAYCVESKKARTGDCCSQHAGKRSGKSQDLKNRAFGI